MTFEVGGGAQGDFLQQDIGVRQGVSGLSIGDAAFEDAVLLSYAFNGKQGDEDEGP